MCGIGGRTVAEAQQRISYAEFCRWAAYRRKRGSLNLGMRIEYGSALLATLYANVHRKKDSDPKTLFDFMPHQDAPPLTLEQAMEAWQ